MPAQAVTGPERLAYLVHSPRPTKPTFFMAPESFPDALKSVTSAAAKTSGPSGLQLRPTEVLLVADGTFGLL